ncbi:MAG: hypothetical protein EOO41_04305, partial [Methanobacteriota archaeon]
MEAPRACAYRAAVASVATCMAAQEASPGGCAFGGLVWDTLPPPTHGTHVHATDVVACMVSGEQASTWLPWFNAAGRACWDASTQHAHATWPQACCEAARNLAADTPSESIPSLCIAIERGASLRLLHACEAVVAEVASDAAASTAPTFHAATALALACNPFNARIWNVRKRWLRDRWAAEAAAGVAAPASRDVVSVRALQWAENEAHLIAALIHRRAKCPELWTHALWLHNVVAVMLRGLGAMPTPQRAVAWRVLRAMRALCTVATRRHFRHYTASVLEDSVSQLALRELLGIAGAHLHDSCAVAAAALPLALPLALLAATAGALSVAPATLPSRVSAWHLLRRAARDDGRAGFAPLGASSVGGVVSLLELWAVARLLAARTTATVCSAAGAHGCA